MNWILRITLKGEVIVNLKETNIIAPFNGVLGYRGITGDIFDSSNSIIITLDDNSVIFSDLKIPEIFAPVIKKRFAYQSQIFWQ
jgi:membrane fusion protein (multidrug efflux system)